MAEFSSKNIGDLDAATAVAADTIIPCEQNGKAVRISGEQIAAFARESSAGQVSAAQKAAEQAKASAEAAAAEKSGIDESLASARQSARESAEQAALAAQEKKHIIDMGVSAVSAEYGEEAAVEKSVSTSGVVTLKFRIPRGQNGKDGENGSMGTITSIVRTSGNGAAGTVDTYTVTCSDGATFEFYVRNGADGNGAGDMTKNVYDPTGKAQDVFAYVDTQIEAAIGTALGGSY